MDARLVFDADAKKRCQMQPRSFGKVRFQMPPRLARVAISAVFLRGTQVDCLSVIPRSISGVMTLSRKFHLKGCCSVLTSFDSSCSSAALSVTLHFVFRGSISQQETLGPSNTSRTFWVISIRPLGCAFYAA